MSKIQIPDMLKDSLDDEYNWWEGEKECYMACNNSHDYQPFKKLQALMQVVHRHNHKVSNIGDELLTVIKYLEDRGEAHETKKNN